MKFYTIVGRSPDTDEVFVNWVNGSTLKHARRKIRRQWAKLDVKVNLIAIFSDYLTELSHKTKKGE